MAIKKIVIIFKSKGSQIRLRALSLMYHRGLYIPLRLV